jgi:hypothetical protein
LMPSISSAVAQWASEQYGRKQGKRHAQLECGGVGPSFKH